MRVLLVRHAESANNTEEELAASSYWGRRQADPDLTKRGLRRSVRLAACLSNLSWLKLRQQWQR
jgi:broad specificity phosphatase PhoE